MNGVYSKLLIRNQILIRILVFVLNFKLKLFYQHTSFFPVNPGSERSNKNALEYNPRPANTFYVY